MTWDSLADHIAPAEYVHAVGALALAFNKLEFELYGLLGCFLPEEAVPSVYYALHNAGRVDHITRMANRTLSEAECSAVEYGLKCFNICAENRNLLIHAMPDIRTRDAVCFVKAVPGKPGDLAEYYIPLEAIREAVTATVATDSYLGALVLEIMFHDEEGGPLPERPPQPRKLSLYRHVEDLTDEAPPPQS
jgi:hypothetical protein